MDNLLQLNRLYLKDTSFVNLMAKRIYNVLLVANPYDAFMLEDDGRIDEKLFSEYSRLGLRYPPRFTQVSTQDEATTALKQMRYELVICMPNTDNSDAFDIGRNIKTQFADIPLVVLTPFSHGITHYMENQDLSMFEYVFCWLGNTELLLSIIKLIEDKMNLEHDIQEGGVQMVLLVEDSIRFYSSVLPNLYKYVLEQSQSFATEALNAHEMTLRMRGRPKIVLARTYEEAWNLYDRYRNNTQGVISDVRFPRNGVKDPSAGYCLLKAIREADEFIPLIMQSSETENSVLAQEVRAGFIDKNSKKMNVDLRKMLEEYFGFGDLIFRNPQTREEVCRIHNLKDLQDNIFTIPDDSLLYHTARNHISRWLCSRAMFPLSEFLKNIKQEALRDVQEHRQIIFEAIVKYRKMKNQGVVAEYLRERFDRFSNFARIGDGSLGGKGRGIAFIDHILKRHPEFEAFPNVEIYIPKTLVLCTDIFDRFMDDNNLYQVALSDASDEEILGAFLAAPLPEELMNDIRTFCEVVNNPIAVRSSSLLEDSHYQPYAGVYATYMIPNLQDSAETMHRIADGVRGVYASVYYHASKAYMSATSNVIDQEKMAIILQEVVGDRHGSRFYPQCSGVARSLNFYPIGNEKVEEGIVNLAFGLGKHIVDGGKTLRVSPAHPDRVMQTSELHLALTETQSTFLALDLNSANKPFSVDEAFDLMRLPIKAAEEDGSLEWVASTYSRDDDILYDTVHCPGKRIITFANVLQQQTFPLAQVVQLVLKYGFSEMRRPVEVEFAVRFDVAGKKGQFFPLQIRPIVSARECIEENLQEIPKEELLIYSSNSLGNGIVEGLRDIVYVPQEAFGMVNNRQIADAIRSLNRELVKDKVNYVLAGPGRWGSNDYSLGIPVDWPAITGAKVIVELGMDAKHIEPSQGTHFFQNLTSFGIGYFTVNPYLGVDRFDRAALDALPAVHETAYYRHVQLPQPFIIKMDGLKSIGVVQR